MGFHVYMCMVMCVCVCCVYMCMVVCICVWSCMYVYAVCICVWPCVYVYAVVFDWYLIRISVSNNPQSAYALHTLNNQHKYGPIEKTMTLFKTLKTPPY